MNMEHQFKSAIPLQLAAAQAPKKSAFSYAPQVISALVLSALLLVGVGGWATLTALQGAIVTQGMLKVENNVKEVQHRDGGIVTEIAVKHGDRVSEGQLLVKIDDVQTRAELSIIRTQLGELMGRQARLIAERDNRPAIVWPQEVRAFAAAPETVSSSEQRLFEGNLLHRTTQKQQLQYTIDQTTEELSGLLGRYSAKTDEIALVTAERIKLNDLFANGLIASTRVHSINVEWIRLRGEKGEIEAAIARARIRIGDARLQISAVDQNAFTEAQRELRQVDPKIAELHDRRVAVEDRLARVDIRAPIQGRINEMSIYTIGGVTTPAAKILTIVPEAAELRVEVRIMPSDIDQVKLDQSARLRFSSFNRNTTPEISGRVVHISPYVTRDTANGAMFYTAELVPDTSEVAKLGFGKLQPGMPVEVFITTDERTPLSYLVKPLSDQFARAFRER